ncbi:hypothetical protein RFI_12023 [Reticulomyxa filosa]|uniref:Uncharacterized protein n=1 Tax=Reticulomyxa filosa TaxID=46433 RepID=X6NGK4_RETFI|nr:hypothetical protein RFI_12023 [Reticulomyxa filosa]|eukprot:ETO25126.1 hypothetical protein RFI_12023 [Reticulomyxa filosa]
MDGPNTLQLILASSVRPNPWLEDPHETVIETATVDYSEKEKEKNEVDEETKIEEKHGTSAGPERRSPFGNNSVEQSSELELLRQKLHKQSLLRRNLCLICCFIFGLFNYWKYKNTRQIRNLENELKMLRETNNNINKISPVQRDNNISDQPGNRDTINGWLSLHILQLVSTKKSTLKVMQILIIVLFLSTQ